MSTISITLMSKSFHHTISLPDSVQMSVIAGDPKIGLTATSAEACRWMKVQWQVKNNVRPFC
jgi:hypothetical protein